MISFFLAFSLAACGSPHPKRTDLTKWTPVERPLEGVLLDLPADAFHLQLHPQSTGVGDAVWHIQIEVERKNRSYFESPMLPGPGDRGYSDADYMSWLRWRTTFHPDVSGYHMGDQTTQYQRDIRLPDGDVVSTRATYRFSAFTSEQRGADIAAIERILRSTRPLPEQPPTRKRPLR